MGVTVSFQPTTTTTTSAATQVAFAHQDGAALLLSRSEKTDDWSEKHFLVTSDDSDFSHGTSDVHMTAFSPNGRYLLTADVAGRVIVWSARGLDSTTGSIDAIKMLQIEDTDEDADECRLRHMQL
jgi:WD40 repeat protein